MFEEFLWFWESPLVVWAVIALLKSSDSAPQRKEGMGGTSSGVAASSAGADALVEKYGDELVGEPPRNAKGAERPSEEVLAKRRLERRRLELVDALEKYKKDGFGERYPNVVKATENLKKIEAEQAVAGDRPEK